MLSQIAGRLHLPDPSHMPNNYPAIRTTSDARAERINASPARFHACPSAKSRQGVTSSYPNELMLCKSEWPIRARSMAWAASRPS